MISAYERKCQERSKSEIRDRIFDSLLGSISGNSSNMALGIILLIALPFMMNGIFSVGEFVMFGYYYAFLAYLPDAIGNLVKRKKQTNASLDRLGFLLQEADCAGSVREKDGYDFSIGAGGGKKMFHAAEKGIVILKGEKSSEALRTLFSVCDRELKDKKCIYVPSEPVLFDDSLLENISMGEGIEDAKMNGILAKTALVEDVKTFGDGLLKRCGKKGREPVRWAEKKSRDRTGTLSGCGCAVSGWCGGSGGFCNGKISGGACFGRISGTGGNGV